jgi:hypothetical protein
MILKLFTFWSHDSCVGHEPRSLVRRKVLVLNVKRYVAQRAETARTAATAAAAASE